MAKDESYGFRREVQFPTARGFPIPAAPGGRPGILRDRRVRPARQRKGRRPQRTLLPAGG